MDEEDRKSKKCTRLMRVVSFTAGCGFMVLAAADAMFDPFPGPETFFATTGAGLIVLGVTGRAPSDKEE